MNRMTQVVEFTVSQPETGMKKILTVAVSGFVGLYGSLASDRKKRAS